MMFTIILSNRTVTNVDSALLIKFLFIVIVNVKSTDVNAVAVM